MGTSQPLPQRRRPAEGVNIIIGSQPTIVFLTICTKDRRPVLASAAVHGQLLKSWAAAQAWLVGRYVVMPDHLHLFAAPGPDALPLENWVRYWKSLFTRSCSVPGFAWQSGHWDRRLRNDESYDQKWQYVLDNPVRHGLVRSSADWPFQGELNELAWGG
mgnify:CR=1 FL=1